MEKNIEKIDIKTLEKEYSVLTNTLEKARFSIFLGLFFYIGQSELIMDKLLNLEKYELLVRMSYLVLFSYLWVKYGQRKHGGIAAFSTDDGLYFLVSETSKLYSGFYYFINWEDIEQISLNEANDTQGIEIKTKIPLVKSIAPLINTKIPIIKDIHLPELPESYNNIALQTASFKQPEVLDKTVIIEIDTIGVRKWRTLCRKYPVKIVE